MDGLILLYNAADDLPPTTRIIESQQQTIEAQQKTIETMDRRIGMLTTDVEWLRAMLVEDSFAVRAKALLPEKPAQAAALGSHDNPIDLIDEEEERRYWEKHAVVKKAHYKLIKTLVKTPPPNCCPMERAALFQQRFYRMMKQLEETPETHPAGHHGQYSGLEEIERMIEGVVRKKEAKHKKRSREAEDSEAEDSEAVRAEDSEAVRTKASLSKASLPVRTKALLSKASLPVDKTPATMPKWAKALSDVQALLGRERWLNAQAQVPELNGKKKLTDILKVLHAELNRPQATSQEKNLWQAVKECFIATTVDDTTAKRAKTK